MAKAWYAKGLCFECTRCGNCCTGEPGIVRVNDEEVSALARRKQMDEASFRKIYTRRLVGGVLSLSETPGGACIFYDSDGGCGVYEDRPRQCRTWPFWTEVLESPARWAQQAKDCPGMNRGPLRSAEDIDALRARDGTSADPERQP